jgi:hypothetical protein
MAKSHLRVVAPNEVKRTVAPKRQKNADLRTREHLTPDEVEALTEAARGDRYAHRDATIIPADLPRLARRRGLKARRRLSSSSANPTSKLLGLNADRRSDKTKSGAT